MSVALDFRLGLATATALPILTFTMMSFDALEKERKSKSKAVDLVQQARAERELRNQDKKSLSIQ